MDNQEEQNSIKMYVNERIRDIGMLLELEE